MMSFPMVAATAVPERTPTRFRTAAIATAWSGDRDLVDTTVAIAFGASVHPLTNSAPSIRSRTRARPRLMWGITSWRLSGSAES
jgi:hypothetical protein